MDKDTICLIQLLRQIKFKFVEIYKIWGKSKLWKDQMDNCIYKTYKLILQKM